MSIRPFVVAFVIVFPGRDVSVSVSDPVPSRTTSRAVASAAPVMPRERPRQRAASSESAVPADQGLSEAVGALARATLTYGDPSRTQWRRTPGDRAGLRISELQPAESQALEAILRTALSPRGYRRVKAIMKQDDVLKTSQPNEPLGSDRYAIAIYGPPAAARWGWRLEGHHVSIRGNYVNGVYSTTPLSLGTQPSDGVVDGYAPLAERERHVTALLSALNLAQRTEAARATPAPLLLRGEQQAGYVRLHGGVALDTLTDSQRSLVWKVVEDFVLDVDPATAGAIVRQLRSSDPSLVTVAARGGEPSYVRVAFPEQYFEYHNAGRHIHSVWRSATDYGGE